MISARKYGPDQPRERAKLLVRINYNGVKSLCPPKMVRQDAVRRQSKTRQGHDSLLIISMRRLALISLGLLLILSSPRTAPLVSAQESVVEQFEEPAPGDSPILTVDDQPTFRSTVEVVTIPVTVRGPKGEYVTALEKFDFKIFDNNKEQTIESFEVSFLPISMVICVQSSDRIEKILPSIKKTAVLFTDMVLGEYGEAAIMAFDNRLRLMEDFTNDTEKIDKALKRITLGSSAVRLADAVYDAVRLLRRRPPNHRKIIVIISESQNNGSETSMGNALRWAQLENIMVYPVRLSTLSARILRGQKPARSPFPPGINVRPSAPGQVGTPTTIQQSSYDVTGNVIPIVIELVRGVKNLVFNNPLELLAKGTGGADYSPRTEDGLQESIVQIGEDIRSQYLLTYRPNNLNERGIFHRVRVEVAYNGLKVRNRVGYFHAPEARPSAAPADGTPQ